MKIYSWNVNGIRAVLRKDVFYPFLNAEQPDILCLQEVKAGQHESGLDLPEHHICWSAAAKKGYSGTAILSREQPRTTDCCLSDDLQARFNLCDAYGDACAEGRLVTAEYEHFYVVNVYTPNSKDDLSRVPLRRDSWDPALLEYCRSLEKTKPVVYCGDFNVAHTEDDLARPKQNMGRNGFTDEERAGIQAFVDAGYVDTFRMFRQGNGYYTWWSHFGGGRARNIGWRIDYILVSDALRGKVVAADIHCDVLGSDHCPVSVTLAL